jgi:hypothetical protein
MCFYEREDCPPSSGLSRGLFSWLAVACVGLLLTAGATASCGSGSSEPGDAATVDRVEEHAGEAGDAGRREAGTKDATPDGAFESASHTLSTIPNNGGPVLAHPLVVTVTYADDPNRSYVEGLGAYLATSPWLSTVGAEYGVGTGSSKNVELTQNAPHAISDAEVQALVESLVHAGTAPDPEAGVVGAQVAPDPDGGAIDAGADAWDGVGDAGPPVEMPEAIYMMYFPATTAVTAFGAPLCQESAGGYHAQTALTSFGQAFAYAVVSRCPASSQADFTKVASHELIESATDPSSGSLAWAISDPNNPWWYFGGEVGDLCALLEPQWSEGGYTGIQRVYSNASVAVGGDPCLPSSSAYYGTTLTPSEAVAINAGGTATFTIAGWSTAPVDDWRLKAISFTAQPASFKPVFDVSQSKLNNGGKATLTVSVPAGSTSGSYALGLVESSGKATDYTTTLFEIYVP